VTHFTWTVKPARAAALAAVLVLLPGASPAPGPEETLADGLRQLYVGSVQPWERWRRRSSVRLPDGREVSREEAYRDDPAFVAAARRLLASRATTRRWGPLLGTLPEPAGPRRSRPVEALAHGDERAASRAQALAPAQPGVTAALQQAAWDASSAGGRSEDRAVTRRPRPPDARPASPGVPAVSQ
jgi:hypothetical protein